MDMHQDCHDGKPSTYRIVRPTKAYRIENGNEAERQIYVLVRDKNNHEGMNQNQGGKSGRCKNFIDDQAGFMADMSSLTFAALPIDNADDQAAQSAES